MFAGTERFFIGSLRDHTRFMGLARLWNDEPRRRPFPASNSSEVCHSDSRPRVLFFLNRCSLCCTPQASTERVGGRLGLAL
jgi:hypothetical protein